MFFKKTIRTSPRFSGHALWLTASAALAASAVPSLAEVYLTESQALSAVLGDKAIVRREQKALDEALRKQLEHSSNLRFLESNYTFLISTQDGKPAKYAMVLNEIGKSEPITFMVGMSPEGKVTDVVIMVFRENRGWEVKEKRFLNQFHGKTVRSSIRVDEDIVNYTGATLSSKAIARGVKRALLLLDAFYPGEARYKLAAATDFARPLSFSPLATVSDSTDSVGLYRQTRYAMGTHCELRLWCRSSEEARHLFGAGFEELERIEQVFSAYREDSELSFVNREAARGPVQVSEEFFELTQVSIHHARESASAVDITVGPLMKVWGLQDGKPRKPARAELREARSLVGSDKLVVNRKARALRFARSGMELDFGGIVKGYAAERVAQMMEERGAVSALVNLGRSSICASRACLDPRIEKLNNERELRPDEWPIGIPHPDGVTKSLQHFTLPSGSALSTSGTSERQFEIDGKRFSHILNPRTGYPLEGTSSATVFTRSGTQSEAFSKELLLGKVNGSPDGTKSKGFARWVYLSVSAEGELLVNIQQQA